MSWKPSSKTFVPLPDAQAVALVSKTSERVTANGLFNQARPRAQELDAFRSATDNNGVRADQSNPHNRYVTGGAGSLANTDELIQWAAAKWGITTDMLRALAWHESTWKQTYWYEPESVSLDWFYTAPGPASIAIHVQPTLASFAAIYNTVGIMQVKCTSDLRTGLGTMTLRASSTSFNLDYAAAALRFYYDDPEGKRSSWGDSTYHPGDEWGSVGAWFSPYPFNNEGARAFITLVKNVLASRSWA